MQRDKCHPREKEHPGEIKWVLHFPSRIIETKCRPDSILRGHTVRHLQLQWHKLQLLRFFLLCVLGRY